MLGISLYPEKTNFEEMKQYLIMANTYEFKRLFLSLLQMDRNNMQASFQKYQDIITVAHQLGYEVIIDFVPELFTFFHSSYKDLQFLRKLHIDGIRLDAGMTGKEEAYMTKNPYGVKVELNMSNYSHYLEQIIDYGPNKNQLIGCHNFFPQKYTGLSREQFLTCTRKFRQHNLRTAAFVTSQVGEYGPWPLQEGLCTLEDHRYLSIDLQVKDFMQSGMIDDIIIGTMYASEEELRLVRDASKEVMKTIPIEIFKDITDFEKHILFHYVHNYRGDSSDYMIRSTRIRAEIVDKPLPKRGNVQEIRYGDILILNESYGQYKGEVQIALKERMGDERINVVGRVPANQLFFLRNIQRYEDFKFCMAGAKYE